MNLPNKLTCLRVLLIPVFLIFLYIGAIPYHFLLALVVFAAASHLQNRTDQKRIRFLTPKLTPILCTQCVS